MQYQLGAQKGSVSRGRTSLCNYRVDSSRAADIKQQAGPGRYGIPQTYLASIPSFVGNDWKSQSPAFSSNKNSCQPGSSPKCFKALHASLDMLYADSVPRIRTIPPRSTKTSMTIALPAVPCVEATCPDRGVPL